MRRAIEIRCENNPKAPFLINAGYLRTKQRIVLRFISGAHFQDMTLIQVKASARPWTIRQWRQGPFVGPSHIAD